MGQDLAFSRDVIRGIRAYALRRPNWAFRNGPPDAEIVPSLRQWKPDGIIADIVHADFAPAVAAPTTDRRYGLLDCASEDPRRQRR